MKRELPYDEQFRILSHFSIPVNRSAVPAMQLAMYSFKPKSDKEYEVEKRQIKSYDGAEIPVYVMGPRGLADDAPCLVFFHGGGFILPASKHHYKTVREYAMEAGCKVVFPDYRLAPKNVFPTAHEDCYAVYKWTIEHAKELGIDPGRIAIGGDSAGGNLTAGVTLMARDRGLAMPLFQMMIYPATDRRMNTESVREITKAPVWDSTHSKVMWGWYAPDADREDIYYASPMEAPSLEGLPGAYIETADYDSLRDEGRNYADALKEAGCDVEYHLARGTVHGFEMVGSRSEIVRESIARRCDYLRRHFK